MTAMERQPLQVDSPNGSYRGATDIGCAPFNCLTFWKNASR
jgi:hypothetical protein